MSGRGGTRFGETNTDVPSPIVPGGSAVWLYVPRASMIFPVGTGNEVNEFDGVNTEEPIATAPGAV